MIDYFKAMNRSLISVILGGFGNKPLKSNTSQASTGTHTETNVDQVADLMANSKTIIITPGEMVTAWITRLIKICAIFI